MIGPLYRKGWYFHAFKLEPGERELRIVGGMEFSHVLPLYTFDCWFFSFTVGYIGED